MADGGAMMVHEVTTPTSAGRTRRGAQPKIEAPPTPDEVMLDLIALIARALVDRPEDVAIRMTPGEASTIYELRVGEGDLGKVIGRHGLTIGAIRTILRGVAAKEGKRVVLEVLE